MVEVMRDFETAGLSRVYLQHPDRSDFDAVELMGELARRIA